MLPCSEQLRAVLAALLTWPHVWGLAGVAFLRLPLILQKASPGVVPWQQPRHMKVTCIWRKRARPLEAWAPNLHVITYAVFCRPEQVRRPPRCTGWEIRLYLFIEKGSKVMWWRLWIRTGCGWLSHLCHQAATAFHLNVGGAHVNTLCSFELGPQTQFLLKLPTENPLEQKALVNMTVL